MIKLGVLSQNKIAPIDLLCCFILAQPFSIGFQSRLYGCSFPWHFFPQLATLWLISNDRTVNCCLETLGLLRDEEFLLFCRKSIHAFPVLFYGVIVKVLAPSLDLQGHTK